MKNTFPKIQFFTSLVFFLVSFALFFYFYRAVNNLNDKTQIAETAWQTENLRREEIKTLDQSITEIKDERALLDTHFAKSSDVVPFLNTIEGLAPKVGASASTSAVVISDDKAGLVVEVKVSGSFSSIYKFINLLENSPYELQFIGMDLNKETTTDSTGTTVAGASWNANLKLKLISFIN